jgi:hypothetical protein
LIQKQKMELSNPAAAAAAWDPAVAQEYAALLSAVIGESDTEEDPEDDFLIEVVRIPFSVHTPPTSVPI